MSMPFFLTLNTDLFLQIADISACNHGNSSGLRKSAPRDFHPNATHRSRNMLQLDESRNDSETSRTSPKARPKTESDRSGARETLPTAAAKCARAGATGPAQQRVRRAARGHPGLSVRQRTGREAHADRNPQARNALHRGVVGDAPRGSAQGRVQVRVRFVCQGLGS